jgi:hypothetical protein
MVNVHVCHPLALLSPTKDCDQRLSSHMQSRVKGSEQAWFILSHVVVWGTRYRGWR